MKRLSFFVIASCVIVSAGCVPQIIDLSRFLPDQNKDSQNSLEVYDGKVYLIGTLTGDLKEEFETAMTLTTFENPANDGPILISSEALGNLTQNQLDGISAAYAAQEPIILVHVTADQICNFGKQFIGSSFTFEFPQGTTYADVFAIDREDSEHVWQWVMYPPDAASGEDTQEQQQARVGDLIEWMQENTFRREQMPAANTNAINGTDLTQLASVFVNQSNFCDLKNRYQITHYIYSCHSIDTGEDWFYVQQSCRFYGGGLYSAKRSDGSHEGKGYYLNNINIDSYLSGYENDSSSVVLIQSSPQTASQVNTVTSSANFRIDEDVYIDKDGESKKITGGVTINNSWTVNIEGCETTNASNDSGNNAHWIYQFQHCEKIPGSYSYAISDPPTLATTTFCPMNQWIWRVSRKVRQDYTPIRVLLRLDFCFSYYSPGILSDAVQHSIATGTGQWLYDIHMPYPPDAAN